MSELTVNVNLNRGGGWELALPGRQQVVCETLEDARRVAYLWAAHRRPCELVVSDSRHRELHRELIAGDAQPPRTSA